MVVLRPDWSCLSLQTAVLVLRASELEEALLAAARPRICPRFAVAIVVVVAAVAAAARRFCYKGAEFGVVNRV